MHGHHHGKRHTPRERPGREVVAVLDPAHRASDEDRDETVRLLSEHAAAGRLSLAEFEERVGHAYTAERVGDLEPLLADLPGARLPSRAAKATAVRDSNDWGGHRWSTWLGVGLLCIGIWAVTSISSDRFLYFWPIWVIGPWGMSMLFRGFGRRTSAGVARE